MSTNDEYQIPGAVGKGFWRSALGGFSFAQCVIELFKNVYYALGRHTFIDTTQFDRLVFRDDGSGMGKAAQSGFISLDSSFRHAKHLVSRLFGTGVKHMIFSFCKKVVILTAPKDDPEVVHRFELTPDELEEIYNSQGTMGLKGKTVPKTKKSWPFDHEFGTEITFFYSNPHDDTIARGKGMISLLRDFVPNAYFEQSLIEVDRVVVPAREILGGRYNEVKQDDQTRIGKLEFSFYVIKAKTRREPVMVGDFEVPEVKLLTMIEDMPEALQDRIPPIFRLRNLGLSGTIIAPFLSDFVTEQRDRYESRLYSTEAFEIFVDILCDIADDVSEATGIRVHNPSDTPEKGIQDIKDKLGKFEHIGTIIPEPPGEDDPDDLDESDENETDDDDTTNDPDRPVTRRGKIKVVRDQDEYEVGETITLQFTTALSDEDREHLRLDLSRANATEESRVPVGADFPEKITLKAGRRTQPGEIGVYDDREPSKAVCKITYPVVSQRQPRFPSRSRRVKPEESVNLRVINIDRIEGNATIISEGGLGRIAETNRPFQVRFTAGEQPGTETIRLVAENGDTVDYCDVTIIHEETAEAHFYLIDGDRYVLQSFDFVDPTDFISIDPRPSTNSKRPHIIMINDQHSTYETAFAAGTHVHFFMHELASAIAELKKYHGVKDDMHVADPAKLLEDISHYRLRVLGEIYS